MKAHSGNALISALFIMTLIAVASTMMMSRLSNDIYQTQRFIRSDQLYLASQLVPFWAMHRLQAQTTPPATLPAALQSLYPNLQVQGELYDLQSRFNLNNLTNPQAQQGLLRLIQTLNPSMNKNLIKMICAAAADWINPNPFQDKWSSYYASLTPPYQASHQLFASVSEFRRVAGVDAKLFNQLAPFLTALPEYTPLNLNTASPEVLSTLGLTAQQVEQLIALRGEEGFQTPESLLPLLKQFNLKADDITYMSRYFMSVATVSQAYHQLRLYSLLQRKKDQHQQWQASVLQESLNVLP